MTVSPTARQNGRGETIAMTAEDTAAMSASAGGGGGQDSLDDSMQMDDEQFEQPVDGAGPPPHGLSYNTMALITTNCNAMRSLSTNSPNHLGFVCPSDDSMIDSPMAGHGRSQTISADNVRRLASSAVHSIVGEVDEGLMNDTAAAAAEKVTRPGSQWHAAPHMAATAAGGRAVAGGRSKTTKDLLEVRSGHDHQSSTACTPFSSTVVASSS